MLRVSVDQARLSPRRFPLQLRRPLFRGLQVGEPRRLAHDPVGVSVLDVMLRRLQDHLRSVGRKGGSDGLASAISEASILLALPCHDLGPIGDGLRVGLSEDC